MTRLGWSALLGASVTGAALALGSRPLTVAGLGLLLAVGLARAWAGAARGPVALALSVEPRPAVEGDRVRLRVELHRASRVPVGTVTVRGTLGRWGDIECRLPGHGRVSKGVLDLGRLPRGRFELSEARVVLGDHLGLGAVTVPAEARAAVLVHPRLVDLGSLFTDMGRLGDDGRRLLFRRPVGFDLHSVREYEQGESLRRVHWPTTARRGQLMVKELQDSPRDTVAVLLDCDPAGAAGEAPDASFDVAVRAAGSLVKALVGRGRRASLVTTGRESHVVTVRALDGDLVAALDVLASAQPDSMHGLANVLRRSRSAAMQAGQLFVVTSVLDPLATAELVRATAQRRVAVVWIDAPSFRGRPTRVSPGALRLAAAGIPIAIVRSGDELAAALELTARKASAHA
ncbi:MAG: DUF58 domain-containing protein [Gaiellaceae bacterium]